MDIKKSGKYENRELGAEKTATKKFTVPRHFIQDNITHYNYYFNANNKLNEVLARAKAQYIDDYTKLLSFYNYSLEGTSRDKRELDSIIYKCTAGILLHDLRNDWIDNLYMLIGKAYYFRNMPDSAYITFQFVNYAYSPKEKGGYDKTIGSNANSDEGGSAFIISTKEKRSALKKVFSLPPSRNEAFTWLVRSYLARDAMPEAAVLIDILKHDPQFPQRLQTDLQELQAWWFYKQEMYDSSAIYLQKALPNAANQGEQARWEYLIAQMYERSNKPEEAKAFYEKVFHHAYDPVLEIYARLNYIRQSKGNDEIIQQSIDALSKMGRRDRYESYRDIIYYSAAQIELERNNKAGAQLFLLKCVKWALPNSAQKNKAFLKLGDLAFEEKKYKAAKNFYDSVDVNDKSTVLNPANFKDRKVALDKIVIQLNTIQLQDSLQRIAAMTKEERDSYIKKLVKAFRKEQGLKEEEQYAQQNQNSQYFNTSTSVGLFNTPANADWYFYNSSLKAKGYTDFKTKWGNRQNTDNWQVASLSSQQQQNINERTGERSAAVNSASAPAQVNFESLLAKIPLTPDKLKISNDSVENALFELGKSYEEGLPDYPAAIEAYEKLLSRYPSTHSGEEALFNLYYCYKKLGDEVNATRVLNLLKEKYPAGQFTIMASNPNAAIFAAKAPKIEATKNYEDIYTSFIEGRFAEALAEKKNADSVYGKKYWTPQLLYIEAVYYIKERQDSAAKSELNNIVKDFAGTPMAARAKNLLDVLSRRKQIEDYLTNLKIERAKDDSVLVVDNEPAVKPKADTVQSVVKKVTEDTTQVARAKIRSNPLATAGQKRSDSAQSALQKIKLDASQALKIKTDSSQLIKMRNQVDSIQTAMKKAMADSAKFARLKQQSDSINLAMQKIKDDSTLLANRLPKIKSVFAYAPDLPHSVVILVNKVDPVYVTEARNAFNRYNRESYAGKPIEINNIALNDTAKLVVISGFENAASALDYMDKARKQAPRDIIPWLPANKYSFLIITGDNLAILQSNKDLVAYQKFLSAYFPGKF